MAIIFDEEKRLDARERRGLDFRDAAIVFAGETLEFEDNRQDYGEPRFVCVGRLHGRMVVIAWTPRGQDQRVFSMRKANEREQRQYEQRLDHFAKQPGKG